MSPAHRDEEAQRLERLWSGGFGDAYALRNIRAGEGRGPFWRRVLGALPVASVLEAGCNVGGNLRWIDALVAGPVCGVEINPSALARLRQDMPGVACLQARARELPFRDRSVDLVFTMGVLIHQPETSLAAVMAEIVRCARRFVLCGEYFAPATVEVPYRGETGALFKRDYGRLYQELAPALRLRERGFLGRAEGWDDVTYWVFEKP